MSFALRVRIYDETGELQADTDPDAPDGSPGAERFEDMLALFQAVADLLQEFHGEALTGLRPMGVVLLGDTVRGYFQPHAVSHGHGFVVWVAQVDIRVA